MRSMYFHKISSFDQFCELLKSHLTVSRDLKDINTYTQTYYHSLGISKDTEGQPKYLEEKHGARYFGHLSRYN